MRLMPVPSYRWCKLCERRWFTASPKAQACPVCSTQAPDVTDGWPHGCSSGHEANHGGECMQCDAEKIAKVAVTTRVAVEWRDK